MLAARDWEEDADDRLRLLFACAHPALAMEARVALTLHAVAGLTTREIAHAFLVTEPTMAQRFEAVQKRVNAACARAGRNVSTVQLIAVSKRQPLEALREAYAGGVVGA